MCIHDHDQVQCICSSKQPFKLNQIEKSGTDFGTYLILIVGVGIAMVAVSALTSLYYNMILAWSYYYFFASFTSDLPWVSCDNSWNTRGNNLSLSLSLFFIKQSSVSYRMYFDLHLLLFCTRWTDVRPLYFVIILFLAVNVYKL